MAKDVLAQVLISPAVYNTWMKKAQETVLQLMQKQKLNPSSIPDEEAEALEDGQLRLHVTLADGTVLAELYVPAEHWRWMEG